MYGPEQRHATRGVISPLLANLFLHYAFDQWITSHHREIGFERYADDAIVHCRTREQPERMREVIIQRLAECGLELNLQKTKIVYCKDANRRGTHEHEKFTFLGHEFRPRRARNRCGKDFVSFLPAISEKGAKSIRQEMRRWKLQCRSAVGELLRQITAFVGLLHYIGTARAAPALMECWLLHISAPSL